MGDEQGAIPYFERSLKISKEFKNNNMVAITSFNLGRSYVRLGSAEKGIPFILESLHISKNITKAPKVEMWALNGAANAYNQMRQPLKAIPFLNRTLKFQILLIERQTKRWLMIIDHHLMNFWGN